MHFALRSAGSPRRRLCSRPSSAGQAQLEKEEAVDFAVTGKIVSIDAKGSTLAAQGANDDDGVYCVNAMTTIMSDDSGIELSKLKVG